jgi:PPOX class probable F420-dependent enzyme
MDPFTDADRVLLKGRNFGHFATLDGDGAPHVTPMWVDVSDDGYLLINTVTGRIKDRNVARDPRVALSIEDSEDPYAWISIKGRVVEIVEEGARDHIDELSMRYNGTPYPMEGPRIIYRIEPDRIIRPSW